MEKIPEKFGNMISFIAGIIFANAIAALVSGEYLFSLLSFAAIAVAWIIKNFVEWSLN